MKTFGARLSRAVARRGPLCVGIDPHASLLVQWGLSDTPDGAREFCDTVVEAIADHVAVVKPQSAFFERFGSAGIAVLESTIRQCHERGTLVLLDVKRGDIGSTAAAYAHAYLNPISPLYSDAITASPYLGFATLQPMIAEATEHGGGVFALAMTSNADGAQVQRARTADGRSVAQVMLDEVAAYNTGSRLGSMGVVIGATVGETGLDLTRLNGPVLAPGMGTQGGRAEGLKTVFAGLRGLVLPSYSREILRHGPNREALRAAADHAQDECRKALTNADL